MDVDGDSAIPPYAWIAWQLRDAIRAGTPGIGEPMPGESELAEQYGVSRMTAGKVRLPTASERAAVFVPLISVKKPGSAERLYAADAVIVEAEGPSGTSDTSG